MRNQAKPVTLYKVTQAAGIDPPWTMVSRGFTPVCEMDVPCISSRVTTCHGFPRTVPEVPSWLAQSFLF